MTCRIISYYICCIEIRYTKQGNKLMAKTKKTGRQLDDTTTIVADIHGVSPVYVRKVRAGDRDSEEIISTCISYQQGKSKLIQHLKKLVNINRQNS